MKKLSKIAKIYNNKELKEKSIEQQDIVDKIEVMHQQIIRFENMSNSQTIFFLVKYANALWVRCRFKRNRINGGEKWKKSIE